MTNETKEFLFRFLDNEVPVADFEEWIRKDKELKPIEPTIYQDLILFDFEDNNAKEGIKNKLGSYIDRKEFNTWRTKRLLSKIIDDQINIVLATRKLRELYYDTEKFIPPRLGIGFDSELDDVPTPDEYYLWNKKALEEKLKKADECRESVKRHAREFLARLKS